MSDFEKQVAENGILSVAGARVKENVGATLKGEWDASLDFVKGMWDSVVDIADIVATPPILRFTLPEGTLRRNETLEGLKRAGEYAVEATFYKTPAERWDDLKTGAYSVVEPFVKKWDNFIPNPLTDSKQESYDAGYDSVKAVERAVDLYTIVKGGVKLTKSLGTFSKEEASLSKGLKGMEEKNGGKGGVPGLFGDTAKADSALAKVGDGKFKTNAIRFPTNFESLGSYLQSVARKMNIRITKRLPIFETAGGHYRFHDPGPDVPHSKGAGSKVSPERQKQIDALESGEYTGKGNKGTSNPVNEYLDNIVEADKVNATKMNKLKNAIQNNTFSVDELSEISKKMSDLGITKEYNEALIKLDFGKYLKGLIGDPPAAMVHPHAHHILFKKGLGEAQQKLVKEGQEILRKHGIDPIIGKENLVWAPNRIIGQHNFSALENVINNLKAVDAAGADLDDIIEILEDLGKQAASRR